MHQEVQPTRRELLADWTRSAAKFAAIGALGVLSAIGISSSLLGRQPRPDLVARPATEVNPDERAATPRLAETPRAKAVPSKRQASDPAASISQPININTASLKELETLPGIGPALAARIIEDREQFGAYESVEQLDRVRGIGPRLMEKLRPLIRVRSVPSEASDSPENPTESDDAPPER